MLETLVRHLDMVRLTAALAMLLAAVGCTGLIEQGDPSSVDVARKLWTEKAYPALQVCTSCHNGSRASIGFLVGSDADSVRETLMASPVVNLDAPQSSQLITKGQHEGPPLDATSRSVIQEWIQAEKEARNDINDPSGGNGLRTEAYLPTLCFGATGTTQCVLNEISLETLENGEGIPGAKITFIAQGVGSGIYLSNLRLVPGPGGAFIDHPLFIAVPIDTGDDQIVDLWDRFATLKLNLNANATPEQQLIQGGAASFSNFPPYYKIAITFKKVGPFQEDGGPGPGQTGCKSFATFDGAPRQALNTSCGGCHRGQNVNATSALDMTGVDQAGANSMNACNQVRQRVNLADINNSGIFLATTPNNANHPFTFNNNAANHTAFRNTLTPWIQAERDAP